MMRSAGIPNAAAIGATPHKSGGSNGEHPWCELRCEGLVARGGGEGLLLVGVDKHVLAHVTDVVPGGFVLGAGVAQAHDQPFGGGKFRLGGKQCLDFRQKTHGSHPMAGAPRMVS